MFALHAYNACPYYLRAAAGIEAAQQRDGGSLPIVGVSTQSHAFMRRRPGASNNLKQVTVASTANIDRTPPTTIRIHVRPLVVVDARVTISRVNALVCVE